MVSIFDAGIARTQNAPQIERGVVDKIFWKGTTLLESVGKNEAHINAMRNEIENLIDAAIRVLLTYAVEFNQFIEFANLKISDYLESLNLEEMSARHSVRYRAIKTHML